MALMTAYRPLGLVGELQRELNRMFEPRDDASVVTSDWVPAVDVREEAERFLIRADLPGVNPKDIEVTMEAGVLTIRGRREEAAGEDQGTWHRVERVSGQFYRRFALPESADPDRIGARSNHGVLEITIPKRAKEQPRRIDVAQD